MSHADIGVLGLFPGFEAPGGVQASGEVAWEGIVGGSDSGLWTADCGPGDAHLFCFAKEGKGENNYSRGRTLFVDSTRAALLAALTSRWPVRLLLVWHLGLLQLLPFFRVRNARVMLFLHGIEAWRPQDWLTRILLRRVDLFLSNSRHTWDRFLSVYPRFASTANRVVYLGIGSPIHGPIPVPMHPPAILMVSRLYKSENYKGHREMIAAWPLVLKQMPEAELWIAGDGDLRADLEEMARTRGLEGRIRFWGQVSEDKKQDLLARCRCLALPSRSEGFGLVYLEAMRVGRPCLISTVDAGQEVVNPPEAGLAVNPDDSEEMAAALCRLLSDGPEWEAWSAQARQRYERHFTAEQFQCRLISALLSELKNGTQIPNTEV